MRYILSLICLTFLACGGSDGADGEDAQTPNNSAISTVCIGGNTTVTVPDEGVEDILEDEDSEGDGDAVITEDAGPGIDNTGALRHLTRVIVIGDCNQIHTEDNDTAVTNQSSPQ